MRIEQMETLAREMVGDDKEPNIFFVSEFSQGKNGPGLVLISRDFDAAYEFWKSLPRTIETSLEDRWTGTLADTSPIEEGSKILHTCDDTGMLVLGDKRHARL